MPVKVYILEDSLAVDLVYDVMKRDFNSLHKVVTALEVFEFNTEDEAEAFRLGLSVASQYLNNARELTEIPEKLYKSLLKSYEEFRA